MKNNFFRFFLNIILPTIFAICLFIVAMFMIIIPQFEKNILNKKREMIRELTNSSWSILSQYYEKEMAGILDREWAQKEAMSRIENLRYGKDGEEEINDWAIGIKTPLSQNPHGIAGGIEFLSNFDMDWSILPGIYFPIGGNNTIFKSGLELGENLESMRVDITLMHRF